MMTILEELKQVNRFSSHNCEQIASEKSGGNTALLCGR